MVVVAALVLVLVTLVSCKTEKRECEACQCSCGDNILNELMSPRDKRNATGHRRGSYEESEDTFVDELDDDYEMFDEEDDDDSEEDVRAYYESWSEL